MTPYQLAERYVGIREIPGAKHHPLIQFWLSLCSGYDGESADEIPWCSAFVNGIAWELRLPRSKSAAARSWLLVGTPVTPALAAPGHDVVILKRGKGNQGPSVIQAPGHVGFFGGFEKDRVYVLGGNQSDSVSVAAFPAADILGIRWLA